MLLGIVFAVGILGYFLFQPGAVATVTQVFSMKLTAAQIAQYASQAGFTGDDLQTAIAVALAESSGNPNAHGDQTLGSGTGSFGLWQIYSDAHPEYGPDFTQLFDPQTNANAAFQVYLAAGNRFTPWSTFKSGAYTAYLDQAEEGINA